jgi:environmental stress-induced protein Ves
LPDQALPDQALPDGRPTLKIIRANNCRTTLWKNGGGSTAEIAVEPSGASLDSFDWRISMAQVTSDGPFSEFPGIDRTLAVVRGDGLVLTIGGTAPVTLERGSDPISFAGDIATSARLIAGEITDLNVMTRRRRFSHRLQRIRQPVSCDLDGVLVRTREASFRISPAVGSDCYVVLLREHHL